MDIPWYLWPLVVIPVVAITLTTAVTAFQKRSVAGIGFAGLWLAWLGLSTWLNGPRVPVAVFGGVALLVLLSRVPAVSARLADPVKLVVPQTFRVAGGVFLLAMALGLLPPVFAVPAGLGDIGIGIAALFIVRSAARRTSRKALVWFNLLGIVDLVVAVGIGALAGPGPVQLMHPSPSTAAVTQLPLLLIPAAAVPLAAALHLVSLTRLRERHSQPRPTVLIGPEPDGQLHAL